MKLENTGLVEGLQKTLFHDGRMTVKRAWEYCRSLCENRRIQAPTFKTFQWHLKNGSLIQGILVPNPLGRNGPNMIYAISSEAVNAFVDELQKYPNKMLESVDQDSSVQKPKDISRQPEVLVEVLPENPTRWVPLTEAYIYYENRAKKPLTLSWFRKRVSHGTPFRIKTEKDPRANNPSGKKYYVDLDSVDEHLGIDIGTGLSEAPTQLTETTPSQKACPIEQAYHRFENLIPKGLSLIQFKRLVNSGLIHSFIRNDVVYVRFDAVRKYFEGLVETVEADMTMGVAYDYYCSRCQDPLTKARFSELIRTGKLRGGKETDGVWSISGSYINEFLEESSSKELIPESSNTPNSSIFPRGLVSISISDYASYDDMKKVLDLLTEQGLEVTVKP